jgi:hypothetical protein
MQCVSQVAAKGVLWRVPGWSTWMSKQGSS